MREKGKLTMTLTILVDGGELWHPGERAFGEDGKLSLWIDSRSQRESHYSYFKIIFNLIFE